MVASSELLARRNPRRPRRSTLPTTRRGGTSRRAHPGRRTWPRSPTPRCRRPPAWDGRSSGTARTSRRSPIRCRSGAGDRRHRGSDRHARTTPGTRRPSRSRSAMKMPFIASTRSWSATISASRTPAGSLSTRCSSDRCMNPNTIVTTPKGIHAASSSCTTTAGARRETSASGRNRRGAGGGRSSKGRRSPSRIVLASWVMSR